ncbi:hypothetical protein HPB50_002732 [Hyalomma asiaticum]|uniref:Uncharacterized protein n=1 Tax=Hyalomma asiaticum TaxID=266040 RepID=A0ACB7TBP2_HYAAI|nr:hypothetical protein HPB50_002732 [Hyalomma asiaticum]
MKRLKEWGIAPSSAYDFHIEGYCEVTGEFLTTADVHTRLSRTRIVCVDGRSYELVGPFDRVSGMEGNLPARILDEFMHGVPRNWRQVILGWSEQEQQVNGQDRRESRGTSKHRDRPVQRCCAAKGLKTMQRDNVFNFQPQRRHNHTSSASSSPPAKQKSPAKSSIYAPHLQLKEARVIVERLPTAILEKRTPRLGVPGALKNSGSEQAEPIVKPQPCKPVCNAGPSNGDPKHKASESTEALLAITARKGTLKRKAQIKKLVDALAAKEACDDIYQSQTLAGNIPGEFFATQKWDELSDFDPSRMATPVPNSPHLSPGKSQFSFSSSDSPSPERRVSAVAIMQSLRKRDNVANLKPSTPKSRYMKSQNVEKVLQGLRKLESKLEKEKLKENCEDSIEEEEDTDYESSQDELLLLH